MRPKGGEGVSHRVSAGRLFQTVKTGSAKALGQKHEQCLGGISSMLVRVDCRGREAKEELRKIERGPAGPARTFSLSQMGAVESFKQKRAQSLSSRGTLGIRSRALP